MKSIRSIILLALTVVLLAACSFGPPPDCAEGLGGTADEALFAQYFASMELVDSNGQPGGPAENGVSVAAGDALAIKVDAVAEASLRACIQFLSGRAIAFDETFAVGTGEQQLALGPFAEAGDYVVRVIVDGVLVKNLPFTVQ